MGKEVITLNNVNISFSKQEVLKDISFKVNKGEILGILGPSGSGKTTLIKAIVGMIAANKGEVGVLGMKMPSLKASDKIGYMAQADALYDDLSALDNLLFFGELYGLKGEKAKKKALELLKLVNLDENMRKKVSYFSGGMKRRLSLAIALIHEPEILILDEPTVGIDPVLRREFWDEFERIREGGATIILTTHVMDEAEHCDRLALIREGEIIALETPDLLKVKSKGNTIEDAFLYFASLNKEV
ncbi:ABC transporter ATP-binding protein [Desnuesiella massiliensis]|uniref:ABC transporter ATP-binding protein n=1 Tax=Desnuesiella massiliensis TaxID=1650662 RepID=UPI0006E41F29|nr:ABC transporter ATP-binding protein [Desnuesiella massiliensis]